MQVAPTNQPTKPYSLLDKKDGRNTCSVLELPITKDRPTSVGVDLDIGAVKDVARDKATDQGGRNSHGDNQGVGARVRQPVLSHVLLFMLVQKSGRSASSWGRRLHAALSHTVTRSRRGKKKHWHVEMSKGSGEGFGGKIPR
jgi:hypothetical protein